MKSILSAFVLELGAYLVLLSLILVLMGVPALWTGIGALMALDLAIILFLAKDPQPPVRRVSIQFDVRMSDCA